MKSPPKISGRALAEKVGLSEGRVRQIVNGYKTEGGQVIEITAPTDTLTRIAEELKIDAADMQAAGREDVAEILRRATPPRVGITEEGDLWLSDNSQELEALRAWLDAGDDNTRPPTIALALWDVDQLLDAAKQKHEDELRLLNFAIFSRGTSAAGGDGNVDADHAGDPASNTQPGSGPEVIEFEAEVTEHEEDMSKQRRDAPRS